MERATHRPGLDQATVAQGARDLAGPGLHPTDTDGEVGRRRDLRLDTAEPTDDCGDPRAAHGFEEMPLHPPRQRLLPSDPHRHAPSVTTPTSGKPAPWRRWPTSTSSRCLCPARRRTCSTTAVRRTSYTGGCSAFTAACDETRSIRRRVGASTTS